MFKGRQATGFSAFLDKEGVSLVDKVDIAHTVFVQFAA